MPQVKVAGKSVSMDASYAVIDTGTSLFTVYGDDFKTLVLKLIAGFTSCGQTQDGMVGCICEDYTDFPVFTVTLGGYDFDVLPEYYIMEEEVNGSQYCFLLIQGSNFKLPGGHKAWILGDVFIRGYYMEFDMEEMTIGIAGGVTTDYRHKSNGSSFPVWAIVLIVIGCLAGVATAAVLVFLCMRKRRRAPKRNNYVPLGQPLAPNPSQGGVQYQGYPPAQPQAYYAR